MEVKINMGAKCYWITGLSGTGKTTLATFLTEYIRTTGRSVVQLDGDELREVMATNAYTREERLVIGMRYSRLCRLLVNQGIDVVIGVIGLFKELHAWIRENISEYIEIFVDTPMDELKRRDPKGIYAKVLSGEISNVAGVDMKIDKPDNPHVCIRWKDGKNVDVMCNELLEKIYNF